MRDDSPHFRQTKFCRDEKYVPNFYYVASDGILCSFIMCTMAHVHAHVHCMAQKRDVYLQQQRGTSSLTKDVDNDQRRGTSHRTRVKFEMKGRR